MSYIIEHEGVFALFKGIGPQILKGLLVQGILMTIKERMELASVVLFAYVRTMREKKLKEMREAVQKRVDVDGVVEQAKGKLEEGMKKVGVSS